MLQRVKRLFIKGDGSEAMPTPLGFLVLFALIWIVFSGDLLPINGKHFP